MAEADFSSVEIGKGEGGEWSNLGGIQDENPRRYDLHSR